MKKIIMITLGLSFLVSNVFAGCMKSEIKQLDTKLSSTEIDESKKAETKLNKFINNCPKNGKSVKLKFQINLLKGEWRIR